MWPPSDEREAAIRAAAAPPLDWNRFHRVAARHRIMGLVRDGLKRSEIHPPSAIDDAIRTAAAAQLRNNLSFAAELVRLQRAFDQRNLPVTVFKGIPTGLQIYGNLATRHAKDIDMMVAPASVLDACALLESAGYRRVDPPTGVSGARLKTLLRTGKDFVFQHAGNSELEVELHWRLFNNQNFMDQLETVTETFPALDNTRFRTFSGDDQFAYLCAHGAAFAWCRLKWLADVGAILARNDPDGMVRLYEAAIARGAGRPAGQAILLCQRLLGLRVADDLLGTLRGDRQISRLERLAIQALTSGEGEADPYDSPGGMKPIARSLWLLGGTAHYLWGEFKSRWISWNDVIAVPLPDGLQFAYAVLRLPLWLKRKLASRAR